MAIGLSDIKNTKKSLKSEKSGVKEKALRPWEGYDTYGNQTRTVGAQEAVRKAREIVESNDRMIRKLKIDVENGIEAHKDPNGKNQSDLIDQEIKLPEPIKIKSKPGILGLFRDMLEF
jgi:hypothetical protein